METAKELKDYSIYEQVSSLGEGGQGSVKLVREKNTQKLFAVKLIPRGPKIDQYVELEVNNHRILLHHHVIQFKEVLLLPSYLGIVMEYAPGGNTLDYVIRNRGLSEDSARWLFQQLIFGLDYCHKMGIVNRDIKLGNTLLDGDELWPILKICDFGYSKHIDGGGACQSYIGTIQYLAPEVITNKPGQSYDGKAVDTWSCGVFLFVLMVCNFPFGDTSCTSRAEIIEKILHQDYTIPDSVCMSDDCKDFLRLLLCKDPRDRISIPSIMEHKWFMTNLPAGAKQMNRKLREKKKCQSDKDIEAIINKARTDGHTTVDELKHEEVNNVTGGSCSFVARPLTIKEQVSNSDNKG